MRPRGRLALTARASQPTPPIGRSPRERARPPRRRDRPARARRVRDQGAALVAAQEARCRTAPPAASNSLATASLQPSMPPLRAGEPDALLRGANSVLHQHGDRHLANAARHRSDERRALAHMLEVYVAAQTIPALAGSIQHT